MIVIVDYGVGNIQAFMTLYKRLGINVRRARHADDLHCATHLILPGVGHFDYAMKRLSDSGMRPKLESMVLGRGVPILGVCVGMQMLASGSDEGNLPGLNWIPGRVRSFANNPLSASLPMPHMGWNDLKLVNDSRLFPLDCDSVPLFYFLHSFYFDAENRSDVVASASYGLNFDAVVSRGHIHGVQCHPEKSHRSGLLLLKNFANI
jgi:glutamine amidotransferase